MELCPKEPHDHTCADVIRSLPKSLIRRLILGFTALEVTTGLVQAGHYRRRRRVEFLDFMNRLIAAYPNRVLHVILDNLNIHKPKCDRWRRQHPNVHFHYTPTHALWLNQVEIWFSLLSRQALRPASFQSTEQLRNHIDAFIAAYNQTAHPFDFQKPFGSRPLS